MGAEILLYGYGLVCLSMLAFNLVYGLHLRSGDRRLRKRTAVLARRVEAQVRNVGEGRPVRDRHLVWMRRRLSRVSWLLTFDRFLEGRDGEEVFREYLCQLRPVFLYLTSVYCRRDDTQAAYFCHFLARNRFLRRMQMDQFQQMLLTYLKKDSLYCRVNALKALCAFGSPETLIDALRQLGSQPGTQLHEKVITEALLSYTGEAGEIIRRLWERFDQLDPSIQRAVLDYIRFASGDYGGQMGQILRDRGRDKELRFAAIRYFGRYPDPEMRSALLEFVRDPDPLRWEYAAISAAALARYPGQEVVDGLMRAMSSPSWYVRYNASASLEAHGLSYEELLQVLGGGDRYAREMLTYRLEVGRMERAARTEAEQEAAV